MKITRKGPDKVRITCTNAEATAFATLLNCACIDQALRKIWPRTFYSDPYTENGNHDQFKRAGISGSEIATGKKYPVSRNPITFSGPCCITDLMLSYLKHSKPSGFSYPIPVESTKRLPVSPGERMVQRNIRRLYKKK